MNDLFDVPAVPYSQNIDFFRFIRKSADNPYGSTKKTTCRTKEEVKNMKTKKNKKGFTLAELLIVVAIIAVLVAIAIPIFTTQLEKSRESTDLANIRSAYATVQSAALLQDSADDFAKNNTADMTFTRSGSEGSYVYQAVVTLKQAQDAWQSVETGGTVDAGGISIAQADAKAGGTATVAYNQADGTTTIEMST